MHYYRFVTSGHVAVLERGETTLKDLTGTYTFTRLKSGNYQGKATDGEQAMFGMKNNAFAILMTSSNRARNANEMDILEPISEERALGLAAILQSALKITC